MKHTRFSYSVSAVVEFTGAELLVLYSISRKHYDGWCQSVSLPGKGSFLHGAIIRLVHTDDARNERYDEIWAEEVPTPAPPSPTYESCVEKVTVRFLETFKDATVTVTLSSDEVDTLNKILEMAHYCKYQFDTHQMDIAAGLVMEMRGTFRRISDEWVRLDSLARKETLV